MPKQYGKNVGKRSPQKGGRKPPQKSYATPRKEAVKNELDQEIEREMIHALPDTDYRQMPPCTMLSPVPAVMVSCKGKTGALAKDNILTVAWAGTICSEPPMVGIAIRPSRFSYEQIKESGEFVVNLVDELHAEDCDFCGVKSGREVDKWAERDLAKLPVPALERTSAIAGTPVYLACKVKQVLALGSHDLFIGEVVSVGARPNLFDAADKLCLDKAKLVAYNHGDYVALGRTLGFFGYSVASDKVKKTRMMPKNRTYTPKRKK